MPVAANVTAVEDSELQRLRALHRLLVSLNTAHAQQDICDVAIATLLDATAADGAAILLFDDEGVNRCKASASLSDEHRGAVTTYSPWTPGELNAHPIVVQDLSDHPSLSNQLEAFAREGIRALAFIPLVFKAGVFGEFILSYREPHACTADELEIVGTIATQVALATERKHEKQPDAQAQLLLEASASLLATPHSADVLTTILNMARQFISADAHAVWRQRGENDVWALSCSAGLSNDYMAAAILSPAGTPALPVSPAIFEDVSREPFLERRRESLLREGIHSMVVVPLHIGGKTSGTVVFYWRAPRHFTEAEVRLATTIGNLASAALGTAELYERQLSLRAAAEAAESRAKFLADAGMVLASSLDFKETLAAVARLAVPVFADWAAVDILGETGVLQRVAVTHADPEKIRLAYDFAARYPRGERDPARVALGTGKSVMIDRISDEMIEQGARDAAHAAAIRQLGISSLIVAPMIFGKKSLGVITFATSESGHFYNAADLQTAEELARRAALAVEHARLHRDALSNEERSRAIVETTPECVKMVAPDGTLLHMNSSGLGIVGAGCPEDVIGQSVYDLIAPEFRDAYRAFHESICRGEKGSLEFDIIGLTGRRRQMESHAAPLRQPDGTIVHLAISREVTESKASEREAQLLSAIVDSSDDAIISKDLNGVITSWNMSAERLFGYTAAEAIGKPVTILIPADRLDEEPMILSRLKRGERVDHFDTIRQRKDGTSLNISLTISPVRDRKGKIIGASKIARDVTDRKRTESALLASEERFRQLADAMPQIVWTARPDGYCDYYNERWYEYTGFSREVFGDEGWEPILHPDDVERWRKTWYEAVESGNPHKIEYRFWDRQERRWRWFTGRALAVRGADGNIVKWFGSCTDIDDQKHIEDDLRRANMDLEQFAFSASHDLREPLRSVKIYSELLANTCGDKIDGKSLEFLKYLQSGATRMEMLVRDLLTYTQVTRFEQLAEPAEAGEALEAVLANLATAVSEAGARITAAPLPSLPVHGAHLQQLFQNLIGNAIKYRSPDRPPEVHVTAGREDGHWHFSVSDNGIGIDSRYRKKIFGLFKRLHANDEYSGTGIGLAICQRIVDRYHGRIWVESELGQGSTFRFTLPA